MEKEKIKCDLLVVGSGPGGSVTAYLSSLAGVNVVLLEEGSSMSIHDTEKFSLDEMNKKYRNGGITTAFGKTRTVYLEARCVGGGTEINAGLYNIPSSETLDDWSNDYNIQDFGDAQLKEYFEENEKDISISCIPYGIGPAAQKMKHGSDSLGWANVEVPRCWKYEKEENGQWSDSRQSMTETLIPKALEHGCRLLDNSKVKCININNKKARSATAIQNINGEKKCLEIEFSNVFICCGAIQTPLLLRRSGIKKNIGNSLVNHPAVRMIAVFDTTVNDSKEGVSVVQVKEFNPKTTLGGSFSGLPHLALWMSGKNDFQDRIKNWKNMAMYYAQVKGEKKGTVRNIPFVDEPYVRIPITIKDLQELGEGLYNLGKLLLKAGAQELHIPIIGYSPIKTIDDLEILKQGLPQGKTDISTIHLFSSCPMGEDRDKCAVNSYGKIHDYQNIYLNDASILPNTPGVNPQAVIMAIARRNVKFFLKNTKKT